MSQSSLREFIILLKKGQDCQIIKMMISKMKMMVNFEMKALKLKGRMK